MFKFKNMRLARLPGLMLKTGLFIVCSAYLYVLGYICQSLGSGQLITTDITAMLESVTMSLLLVVAASLTFDIHIKREERNK